VIDRFSSALACVGTAQDRLREIFGYIKFVCIFLLPAAKEITYYYLYTEWFFYHKTLIKNVFGNIFLHNFKSFKIIFFSKKIMFFTIFIIKSCITFFAGFSVITCFFIPYTNEEYFSEYFYKYLIEYKQVVTYFKFLMFRRVVRSGTLEPRKIWLSSTTRHLTPLNRYILFIHNSKLEDRFFGFTQNIWSSIDYVDYHYLR